jgi:hypothetical protein
MLHPLVAVTTLIWGVLNGSKVALVGSFFMAGVAQLWLGRVIGLSLVARLWSSAVVVSAGHLSGRMEPGNFGLLLSTAACALVLPPLVALLLSCSRRMAVLLGITLAMALVAGQGYMQVGILATLPVSMVLVPTDRKRLALLTRRLALAAGVALLLSAPLIVPLVHFLPEFGKDSDSTFRSAQPLTYVPLNLVIGDIGFYRSEALAKLPYPYLYTLFVGWVPVLLAVCGLLMAKEGSVQKRIVYFLTGTVAAALLMASAAPIQWIRQLSPYPEIGQQLSGLRYVPVIAGIAVAPLLALSGLGLDWLLSWVVHHRRSIRRLRGGFWRTLAWVLVVAPAIVMLPLGLTLRNTYAFGRHWIQTIHHSPELSEVLQALRTPDMQWVNTPFGEQFWVEPAVAQGLKLNLGTQGWYWKGRKVPEAVLEAHRSVRPENMVEQQVAGGIPIFSRQDGREYASVQHADGSRTICTAQGKGGTINVVCESANPGLLTVKENNWYGWRGSINGQVAHVRQGQWLSMDLPAGKQQIAFRYLPWDVSIGLILFVAGAAIASYLLLLPESAVPVHLRHGRHRLGPGMGRTEDSHPHLALAPRRRHL